MGLLGSGKTKSNMPAQALYDKACAMERRRQFEPAAKIYLEAAEAGHAEALFQISKMDSRGEGVASNSSDALYWMKKAAEGGCVEAQYELGLLGITFSSDSDSMEEAVEWLEQAADAGHARAQYEVGMIYADFDNEYLMQDTEKARYYLELAAAQGIEGATRVLNRLNGQTR